jgi:hypothetical protein
MNLVSTIVISFLILHPRRVIMSISYLPKTTPHETRALIEQCIKSARATEEQTVFKTDALKKVIKYIEVKAENEKDYNWNPLEGFILGAMEQEIHKSLGIFGRLFEQEDLIKYLDSNKK